MPGILSGSRSRSAEKKRRWIYGKGKNQFRRNRCLDRVVSCNSPIGELARELPKIFYPLHRGYLVNTLYVTAVRRFEAELISGITLPIPAMTYKQVRQDLQEMLQNGGPKKGN